MVSLLFQASLDQGKIPAYWKVALVVPVSKKGNRSSAASYRPISLTLILCKLCEHIVHTTISSHLDHTNILSDAQHGFRKKRSRETVKPSSCLLWSILLKAWMTKARLILFCWTSLRPLTRFPTNNYYPELHALILQALSLLGCKTSCTTEPKKWYLKTS